MSLLKFIELFRDADDVAVVESILVGYRCIFEGVSDLNHLSMTDDVYTKICGVIRDMTGSEYDSDTIKVLIHQLNVITVIHVTYKLSEDAYINVWFYYKSPDSTANLNDLIRNESKPKTGYNENNKTITIFINNLDNLLVDKKLLFSELMKHSHDFSHECRHYVDDMQNKYDRHRVENLPRQELDVLSQKYDIDDVKHFNTNTEYNAWIFTFARNGLDLLSHNPSMTKREFISLMTNSKDSQFNLLSNSNKKRSIKRLNYIWDNYHARANQNTR